MGQLRFAGSWQYYRYDVVAMGAVVEVVFSDEVSCGIADVSLLLLTNGIYRGYIFPKTPRFHLDEHECAVLVAGY